MMTSRPMPFTMPGTKIEILPSGLKNLSLQDAQRGLILVAMDDERQAIQNLLGASQQTKIHTGLGIFGDYYHIKEDKSLLVVQSGIGLVNAGLAMCYAQEIFKPDFALLLGVGGALIPELEVGDVCLATGIVQHDCRFSSESGDEFMTPGELHLRREARTDHILQTDFNFLLSVLNSNFLAELSGLGGKLHHGVLASGNEFVGRLSRKQELVREIMGVNLVDMEAAGMAQIARKTDLPFAVVKSVADRAREGIDASQDYKLFIKRAAENSALIAKHLAEEMRK